MLTVASATPPTAKPTPIAGKRAVEIAAIDISAASIGTAAMVAVVPSVAHTTFSHEVGISFNAFWCSISQKLPKFFHQ